MKIHFVKNLFTACLLTFIISSCSNEDEPITYLLNSKLVKLNCERTFDLKITPALEGLTYTSMNSNIASVDNKGQITAKLVGTTNIIVKDSLNRFADTVKVVVNTIHTAYSEPFLTYGATKDDILAKIDLHKWYYYAYDGGGMNYGYLYMYDETIDDNITYYYYFPKGSNKLAISDVLIEDTGEVDQHISSRFNHMRTFMFSRITTSYTYYYDDDNTTIIDIDTSIYVYGYEESYFINPDSTVLIFKQKSSRSSYIDIYYFRASKDMIEHVVNADEEEGEMLYYWLFYGTLFPNGEYAYLYEAPKKKKDVPTMNMMPLLMKPDKRGLSDKRGLPEMLMQPVMLTQPKK